MMKNSKGADNQDTQKIEKGMQRGRNTALEQARSQVKE